MKEGNMKLFVMLFAVCLPDVALSIAAGTLTVFYLLRKEKRNGRK